MNNAGIMETYEPQELKEELQQAERNLPRDSR